MDAGTAAGLEPAVSYQPSAFSFAEVPPFPSSPPPESLESASWRRETLRKIQMSKNLDTKIRETKDLGRDESRSAAAVTASVIIARLKAGVEVGCHTMRLWKI